MNRFLALIAAVLILAACTATAPTTSPTPTPGATPTPSPTPAPSGSLTPSPLPTATPAPSASPLSVIDLKYLLLDRFGRPDWCDPDFYPVARAEEGQLAQQHLPEMQADTETYAAILRNLGIGADRQLSAEQVLAIYRDWKVLTKAITLTPSGDLFAFDYTALEGPVAQQMDFRVAGTISGDGTIETSAHEQTAAPPCPICLARGTLIDAPGGAVPVEQIVVGSIVWSADADGRRIAVKVMRVGSTPVPATHRMVHLVLADGRILDVSPGHPLADGRSVGDLRAGDLVDGSQVDSTSLVAYDGGFTFDLLPDSATGTYWANGILLGSTLRS